MANSCRVEWTTFQTVCSWHHVWMWLAWWHSILNEIHRMTTRCRSICHIKSKSQAYLGMHKTPGLLGISPFFSIWGYLEMPGKVNMTTVAIKSTLWELYSESNSPWVIGQMSLPKIQATHFAGALLACLLDQTTNRLPLCFNLGIPHTPLPLNMKSCTSCWLWWLSYPCSKENFDLFLLLSSSIICWELKGPGRGIWKTLIVSLGVCMPTLPETVRSQACPEDGGGTYPFLPVLLATICCWIRA